VPFIDSPFSDRAEYDVWLALPEDQQQAEFERKAREAAEASRMKTKFADEALRELIEPRRKRAVERAVKLLPEDSSLYDRIVVRYPIGHLASLWAFERATTEEIVASNLIMEDEHGTRLVHRIAGEPDCEPDEEDGDSTLVPIQRFSQYIRREDPNDDNSKLFLKPIGWAWTKEEKRAHHRRCRSVRFDNSHPGEKEPVRVGMYTAPQPAAKQPTELAEDAASEEEVGLPSGDGTSPASWCQAEEIGPDGLAARDYEKRSRQLLGPNGQVENLVMSAPPVTHAGGALKWTLLKENALGSVSGNIHLTSEIIAAHEQQQKV